MRDYTRPLFLLGFAGQVAWAVENQFFNTFLYDRIIPDPLYVSLMVGFSALVATVTSIVMGALSDRIGKRRPFLLYGYIVWGVSIVVIPFAEFIRPVLAAAWAMIFLDGLMTFFGSTAFDSTYHAYLADVTTDENRGRAQALLSMGVSLAILIVYGGSGPVIQTFGYMVFFISVGLLVLFVGVLGCMAMPAEKPFNTSGAAQPLWLSIRETFRVDSFRNNRKFFMVLLAMGLWGMGFQVFFPFLLIYLNHYVRLPMVETSVLMFAVIFLGGIVTAYPAGIAADRLGRKPVCIAAVFIISAGLLVFSRASGSIMLGVGGVIWLSAQTLFFTASGAWSKDLYPSGKRGQFSGYMTMFTVAFTMIPGPIIGGLIANRYGIRTVLNGQNAVIPTPELFTASAFIMLITLIPLVLLKEERKTAAS